MQVQGSKATPKRILQAASKLFAAKGFANVSMRDICKESETTAPAIYYYFGSKRGLFEAVVGKQVSMSDFIQKLSKSSIKGSPSKGLQAFVRTYLSLFPVNAFDPGLYMRDSATLDKQSAKMISEDLDRIRSVAARLIQSGIDVGEFRRTDPELASDCLLGMLNRVIFQGIHFSKASDKEAYGSFVTEFFMRAMK